MTLRQVLFETGPDGAGLSNGNSGSSTSSIGAGGSTTFSAAKKGHGTLGAKFTNAANANAFRRWLFDNGVTATQYQFSGVLTVPPVAPAATVAVASFVNAAGAARFAIQLSPTMQIMIAGSGGSNQTVIAPAQTPGAKVRIAIQVTGGSATASVVVAKVYSGTSSWVTQIGSTFNSSTFNTNTDQVVGVDLGVNTVITNSIDVGWDDIQLNDGAGGEINDFVVPLATPVVVIDKVQPPTSLGGNDGYINFHWAAITDASSYDIAFEVGNVDEGFTADYNTTATSYSITGLAAGEYTIAVRATTV